DHGPSAPARARAARRGQPGREPASRAGRGDRRRGGDRGGRRLLPPDAHRGVRARAPGASGVRLPTPAVRERAAPVLDPDGEPRRGIVPDRVQAVGDPGDAPRGEARDRNRDFLHRRHLLAGPRGARTRSADGDRHQGSARHAGPGDRPPAEVELGPPPLAARPEPRPAAPPDRRRRGGIPVHLITPEYLALNAELHRRVRTYGTGGHKWAPHVRRIVAATGAKSVLDYGCGKGTLRRALRGVKVHEYDPAVPGKETLPRSAGVVVCTDVMEHVEPECTEAVIAHLCGLATRAVFVG